MSDTIELGPVPGTRDFYPEDLRRRTWLFGLWRAVALSFGYEEIDACVLEHEELYIRKAGDEITDQLFNFVDKGSRRVSLRPELTPSLARMVLARSGALRLPLRWFAIPQCFRYERMQRGRKREHFQWNMDLVGLATVAAEVELMAAQAAFLRQAGLNLEPGQAEACWRVSDRRMLEHFLAREGVAGEAFAAVCVIVDKRDKIGPEATRAMLAERQLPALLIDRILSLLDARSLEELTPLAGADNPGLLSLQQLLILAEATGLRHLLTIDPSIVRGLSYYTGTVWEVFAVAGTLNRAIAGGGRYDRLLATFGGQPQPMAGFGLGDVPILEVLEELGRLPEQKAAIDDVVAPLEEAQFALATRLATALRAQGRRVAVDYTCRRFKHLVARAEADGAARLLVLGASEAEAGMATVRTLGHERREERLGLATLMGQA